MKYTSSQFGYSLVEVLVSISILLIAIVGPMTIASKGLQNAQFARQQTAATFLAQEGIELLYMDRNKRGLASVKAYNDGAAPVDAWAWVTSNSTEECRSANGCAVALGHFYKECDGGCVLYKKNDTTANPIYSYDSTNAVLTPYTRKIYFKDVTNDSFLVQSEVSWQSTTFGAVKKVVVEAYIYNIYDF